MEEETLVEEEPASFPLSSSVVLYQVLFEFCRLNRAKTVASVLIGSLNQNHNVAVLESSSEAWNKDGKNQSGTVRVLGCRLAGLSPATSHHKEDLVMAVQNLTARGGSDHL